MNNFLNSNRLLNESICSDNIAGVRTALDRGAHLSGAVLLDDNLYTVECAVLNLPLNQAFNEKVSDEIITLLKKAGAGCEIPNVYRCSALYFASANGFCALAEKLIREEGSKIDARNLFGETPLHVAVRAGQQKMVQLLCEMGANIFLSDKSGRTPLKLIALLKESKKYGRKNISRQQLDEMYRILINSKQMQKIEPVRISSQKPKILLRFQKERVYA